MSEGREERVHRIAREEIDEKERLEAIKRRYNNTPLRRILSQQVLGMNRMLAHLIAMKLY